MAGVQLSGKSSEVPYFIKAINTNVYSMEEINYFVYNHINLVYRDFFSEELFEYMEKQLGRRDMAEGFREIAKNNGSVQDFIKYLFVESYYYSIHEMNLIQNYVLNIDNMTKAERLKIEADNRFKEGKLESALRIYFEILNGTGEEKMSEAFYARVAFSIGIIYAKLYMSKNANAYFSYAYDIYPEPAYAKACVYMGLINNDESELLKSIIKYQITDDALEAIRERVGALRREIETSKETVDFIFHFTGEDNRGEILEDWKNDYRNMLS